MTPRLETAHLRRRLGTLNRAGNQAGLGDAERAFIRHARSRTMAALNRARAIR